MSSVQSTSLLWSPQACCNTDLTLWGCPDQQKLHRQSSPFCFHPEIEQCILGVLERILQKSDRLENSVLKNHRILQSGVSRSIALPPICTGYRSQGQTAPPPHTHHLVCWVRSGSKGARASNGAQTTQRGCRNLAQLPGSDARGVQSTQGELKRWHWRACMVLSTATCAGPHLLSDFCGWCTILQQTILNTCVGTSQHSCGEKQCSMIARSQETAPPQGWGLVELHVKPSPNG